MNENINEIQTWINDFMTKNKSYVNINNVSICKKTKKGKIKPTKIRQNKKDTVNILLIYGDDELQKQKIIKTAFNQLNKNIPNNNPKYELINISQEALDNLYNKKDNKQYTIFLYTFFNRINFENYNNNIKIMIINENMIYNFHKYKEILINIVNHNNNTYPLIILLNSSHNKLLTILKKKTRFIEINSLTSNDITLYIKNVLKNNNIIDNTKNQMIELMIKLSNYNLNKVNTLLYDLFNTYIENNIINEENLKNFEKDIIKNNNKEDIRTTNYKLLTKFNGLNESYELFSHDRTNNPLVMEEQYIKKIIQYENDYKNNINQMIYLNKITKKISKSFIYSNLYDTYIFNYQKWDLTKIYGFFSCLLPSYYLSLLNTKYDFKPYIKYPIDMNKSSIQKINTKQINSIYDYINLIDINYYIYLNELIYYLIKKSSNNTTNINRIKITNYTKELIKTYNLNMALIDKILKINKLNDNNIKLSKKLHSYLF